MISIKKVEGRRDLYAFIRFNYHLYKGNAYAVPDFLEDMLDTFNRRKNAAFEFCEADLFLAYKDKKLVGRVAAIINHKANKTWQTKNVRFGWIDFIDDIEVLKALLDTVEQWGREVGPRARYEKDCGSAGLHRYGPRRDAHRRLRPALYHEHHL